MTEAQRSLVELREMHRQARLAGIHMRKEDCDELNRLEWELNPPQIFPAKPPKDTVPVAILTPVPTPRPDVQPVTKEDLEKALKKSREKSNSTLFWLLAICIWHPVGWVLWLCVFCAVSSD